jgi:hypothetical protein
MLLSLVGFLLISKIIVQTSQYKIPVPTESLVETELKTFFSEYSKIKTLDLDVTLLTDNNPYAYDTIKWFLKTGQYKYLIASKCDDEFASSNQTKSLLAISPTIFMILRAEEILDTLDKMTTCPLWHTRSNIIFIIYTQVTNSELLDVLPSIWSRKIFNFVLVFVDSAANVFSYNGFGEEKTLNVTSSVENLFPNKLLDINGYEINVGMFSDVPRNTKDSLGQWYGPDYDLLEKVVFMMNATLNVVEYSMQEHYMALYNAVLNETIDFSFIPYYQIDDLGDIEFSQPRKLENLVVLVPKAGQIPQGGYLFLVLDYKIWLAVVTFLVLIACFLRKTLSFKAKRNKSFAFWLLQSWKCFIGSGGVTRFERKDICVKYILTLWMLISIIIGATFQCSFTSTLAKPKYFTEIDTIQQLRESKMKIFCLEYFRDYFLQLESYGLRDQLVFISTEEMFEFRSGRDAGQVSFIEVYSRAVILQKLYGYHMVEEPIATGYTVYFFQNKSPFIDEIHRCVLIDHEMGLIKKKDKVVVIPPDTGPTKKPHLTFHHLQSIFFILLLGYQLSFVVFLCELRKRRRNKRR